MEEKVYLMKLDRFNSKFLIEFAKTGSLMTAMERMPKKYTAVSERKLRENLVEALHLAEMPNEELYRGDILCNVLKYLEA